MIDVNSLSERLSIYGYSVSSSDTSVLEYCLNEAIQTVKNNINNTLIPVELEYDVINLACANFFFNKKTFSPSSLSGFDLNKAVKELRIGDTTTVFADSSLSDEQKLDLFIDYLKKGINNSYASFRRLKW